MKRLARRYPCANIQLWAQDEARAGLIPTVRRVWAIRGQRPTAFGARSYEWVYLYGFVHPTTGKVFWLLLPLANTEAFSIALEHFAREVGAGSRRHIILVLDNAGWHEPSSLRVPEGIHLFHQPAYSPELQPSEHLWPLIREGYVNKELCDIDELEEIIIGRCLYLSDNPDLVRSHTLFHWWERIADLGTRII